MFLEKRILSLPGNLCGGLKSKLWKVLKKYHSLLLRDWIKTLLAL